MNESTVSKNTIYNLIKSVTNIIFPLITFPYITRVLLVDNVGKVTFGESIVSYFSLVASLGITTYAIRECSKVKENKEKLSDLASQLVSINLISTLFAYAVLFLLLFFSEALYNYRLLISIQSSIIIFATLGADWLNTAMEDLKYVTIRTILFQVIAIILMLVFVHKPEDYYKYAIISVISSSGANITNIFYRRKYCKVRITFSINWKKHIFPILLMFSMILSQTIYCNSDLTMLGVLRGDYEVGIYSVAVKIYNIVNTLVASIAFVVMPQLSYWFERKNYKEINALLRYALGFVITLGIPCLVGVNIVSHGLVEMVAGVEYMEAVSALRILSIALACSFVGGFCGNIIFLPSGRERLCFFANITSALVNLILNFIFIPRFGFIAAAATTAFAEFIGMCIALKFIEKDIKIENVWKLLWPPLLGSIYIVLVAFVADVLIPQSIFGTMITIIVGAIGYVAILCLVKHEFIMEFVHRVGFKKSTM